MNRFYSTTTKKPTVIFVLGGPGSGKSTQSKFIVDKFGFVHLSAGELLRKEMNTNNSKYIQLIRQVIDDGKIVPAQITVDLLKKAMEESPTKKFIIDGFPRNFDNQYVFQNQLAEHVDVPWVLFLSCGDDEQISRIMERAKTSGRSDDNIESMRKRLVTYREKSIPIIEFYKKQGKVVEIGADKTVGEIKEEIDKVFSTLEI